VHRIRFGGARCSDDRIGRRDLRAEARPIRVTIAIHGKRYCKVKSLLFVHSQRTTRRVLARASLGMPFRNRHSDIKAEARRAFRMLTAEFRRQRVLHGDFFAAGRQISDFLSVARHGKSLGGVKPFLFGRVQQGADILLAGTRQSLSLPGRQPDIKAPPHRPVRLLPPKFRSQRILGCDHNAARMQDTQIDLCHRWRSLRRRRLAEQLPQHRPRRGPLALLFQWVRRRGNFDRARLHIRDLEAAHHFENQMAIRCVDGILRLDQSE
jgi:hypothetical protein